MSNRKRSALAVVTPSLSDDAGGRPSTEPIKQVEGVAGALVGPGIRLSILTPAAGAARPLHRSPTRIVTYVTLQ